jgi:hypothetical protein
MTPFATLKLGVPVLRDRVHVLYATPRTPTPFEAVLLDIVHRFAAAPAYRDWSLETVFEELLCVPDPRALLTATLLELKALGVITVARAFDDSEGLAINALALTERGKKMASEKRLLGRQQEQLEEFAHDPLGDVHCDDRRWGKLSTQRPALFISADDFTSDWPEEAFLEHLHRHRPDWYQADTQIESTWVDSDAEVAWDTVAVDACLENGTIHWRCERDDVMDYLAQLDRNSTLRMSMLSTLFSTGGVDADAWPEVNLDAGAVIGPASRAFASLGQHPRVLLSPRGAAAAGAQHDPVQGLARVQHSETPGEPPAGTWNIAWNASHDGCTITLAHDLASGEYDIANDAEGWRLCRTTLMVNGAPTPVALALRTSGTATAVFDELATRMLASSDHQDTAAGLLLTPATEVLPALVKALCTRARGLALLDAAADWGTTVRRLKGKSLPRRDEAMSSMFEEALASHVNAIDIETVPSWCKGIKSLDTVGMDKMVSKLLARIAPLASAGSLPYLLAQVCRVAPSMSLPCLPNLYPAPVIREILDLDTERAVTDLLGTKNGNRFDNAVRDLWRHGTLLAKRAGTSFPMSAPAPDAVRKLATGRDLPGFRAALGDWNRRFDDLVRTHALQEAVQGSRLAASQQAGAGWLEAVERFLDASGASFEHVFVVDTNALIDCPDLPQRLRPTQLLVLPATVIDELDKKKTEPPLRDRCATAVRHLRAMPQAQIRFEIADVSLLPDDYRKTADNRILAVALKYTSANLRLVTGDQNLSLKAQAMNIIAVGVDRFMDRQPPQRKPNVPGAPQRAANNNKRKRTGT